MVSLRAQVILHTADAVPENYISNSWAFELDSYPGTGTLMTTILKDFYDDIVGYLSPVITQNGHEIKYSALPGTPPNYPYEEDVFNLTAAPAGTALPDEIALCLSFQGIRGAGSPQARRRGRIYVGPLDTTAATGNRPSSGLLTALGTAAATLKASVEAIGGSAAWGVWSTVDEALVVVDNGWIDNAFDTQRRRGVLSTSRTIF